MVTKMRRRRAHRRDSRAAFATLLDCGGDRTLPAGPEKCGAVRRRSGSWQWPTARQTLGRGLGWPDGAARRPPQLHRRVGAHAAGQVRRACRAVGRPKWKGIGPSGGFFGWPAGKPWRRPAKRLDRPPLACSDETDRPMRDPPSFLSAEAPARGATTHRAAAKSPGARLDSGGIRCYLPATRQAARAAEPLLGA